MSEQEVKQAREDYPLSILLHPQRWKAEQLYQIYYDDVTANGVKILQGDRHCLAQLAIMSLEMDNLTRLLSIQGESMKVQGDRNVVTKKNPARDALEKLRPKFLQMMKEFKLTPGSRNIAAKELNVLSEDAIRFLDY